MLYWAPLGAILKWRPQNFRNFWPPSPLVTITIMQLISTDFPAYSDTLGTWDEGHCNRIVTVTRGSLVRIQSFGTCQKCHCKRGVTVNSVTVSGEVCTDKLRECDSDKAGGGKKIRKFCRHHMNIAPLSNERRKTPLPSFYSFESWMQGCCISQLSVQAFHEW